MIMHNIKFYLISKTKSFNKYYHNSKFIFIAQIKFKKFYIRTARYLGLRGNYGTNNN